MVKFSNQFVTIIIVIVIIISLFTFASNAQTTTTTKIASSLEFTPVAFPNKTQTYTKEEATKIMLQNLNAMSTYLEQAPNTNIIVFPEMGLFGGNFTTRESIYPFLEIVPLPNSTTTLNPCSQKDQFKDSPILVQASCLAAQYSTILALDMGSYEECSRSSDSNCPRDGRYQYNTQVAFDYEGNLVGRYRKYHLYHEPWYNSPPTPDVSYFDVDEVRYGMMICFDILFEEPSNSLVSSAQISTLLYSSWWANFPPSLISIEVQQAWSRAYNCNLIAANMGIEGYRSSGSGIYSSGAALITFYNDNSSPSTHLLQSSLTISLINSTSNSAPPSSQLHDHHLTEFRELKSQIKYKRDDDDNNDNNDNLNQMFEFMIDGKKIENNTLNNFIKHQVIELKEGQNGGITLELDSGFTCNFTYFVANNSVTSYYVAVIVDVREIPLILPAPGMICAMSVCDINELVCSFDRNATFSQPISTFKYLSISGIYDPSFVVYSAAMPYHNDVISKEKLTTSAPFDTDYHEIEIDMSTIYNVVLMQVPEQ